MTGYSYRKGWRFFAIVATVAAIAAGSGTALALWSQQVEGGELSVMAPVLGLAVTTGSQTTSADSADGVRTQLVPTADQQSSGNGKVAIAFDVTVLTSPNYTMGYTITSDSNAGLALYKLDTTQDCVPGLTGTRYSLGSLMEPISQTTGSTAVDRWCAVLSSGPDTYTNKASASGTNYMGQTETSPEAAPIAAAGGNPAIPGSWWSAELTSASSDDGVAITVRPIVPGITEGVQQ